MNNNQKIAKSVWDVWQLPMDYAENRVDEETVTIQERPYSPEDLDEEWNRRQGDFPKGDPWTEESENPSSIRRLAWYLPYVFNGPRGGIYITIHGLISISHHIRRELLTAGQTSHSAEISLRSAWEFLFLHELYHHRTEMFALSCDASENKLKTYQDWRLHLKYHGSLAGASMEPLDEALSNSYGWRSLKNRKFFKDLPKQTQDAVLYSLKEMFENSPAGYRDAKLLMQENSFSEGEQELIRRMLQKTVTPVQPVRTNISFGLRFSSSSLSRSDVRIVQDTNPTPLEAAAILRMTQEWGGNKVIKIPYMRMSPNH